ncbi:MAG: glycosyltransferase family 4 protein [Bacteroidetes bacterium]|nr:glycosyltransferase family 4 protein [Bacteroidota bacterium]
MSMLKLASEFNNRGGNCLVIVPPDTQLAYSANQYKLKRAFLKPRWKYADIPTSIRLSKILRNYSINTAVIMQSKDMSIAVIAQKFYPDTKLVFFQEMQSDVDKRDYFHTLMYSRLSQWITLTKKMKQDVIRNTEMPLERISVNPIGTDLQRFDPFHFNQDTAKQQFNIPLSKTIIGVLGRLDPQKGQDDLIRAVPILLEHNSGLHFVMAGDETKGQHGFKKKLEKLCMKLGVQDSVQFIPFTDAVPEFLSAIDIFVLPSHSETFGFVLVEAMAMGKAIVATKAGGVPEIITNEETGLLVPPQDETALAEAIIRILDEPDLRSKLTLNARTDALARFDVSKCMDQLVELLDNL